MDLKDRLRELRKDKKMTQLDLANKLEVSKQVISNWERGITEPEPADIVNLVKVLEVTFDYLFGVDYISKAFDNNQMIYSSNCEVSSIDRDLIALLRHETPLNFGRHVLSSEDREMILDLLNPIFKRISKI